MSFLVLCLVHKSLWQFPGFAVLWCNEPVGLLVVESVFEVIINETFSCACGDIAYLGIFGAKASVCDGAGRILVARLDTFQEICGVVVMVVV